MKGQKFMAIMSAILMLALVYAAVCSAAPANDPWAEGAFVPVIINLYPNCSVNETEAINFVNEANEFLKPGGKGGFENRRGFRMVVVKVNNETDIAALPNKGGDDGSGGGVAGDGNFTWNRTWWGEGPNVTKFGGKEINETKNQKGIKIAFGQMPNASEPGTLGLSIHRNPTMIVRKSSKDNRTVAEDTGVTIAHEFGHIMTLGINRTLPFGEKLDETGHSAGPGDIMNSNGSGNNFTKGQMKEMWNNKNNITKCAAQFKEAYPAIKLEQQFGAAADDIGDHADGVSPVSPIYDLDQISLSSLYDVEKIDARITAWGVLPTDEDIDARYTLGFDIDDNVGTGVTYAGYDGIDRIVYVNATGNISLGTFTMTGEVKDIGSGTTVSLPNTPVAETEHEFNDFVGGAEPAATSFLLSIPGEMLNLSAAEAPVVAAAGNNSTIYDTTGFVYDSERWLKDPTFTTFGTGVPVQGMSYPFEISGLEPNSPFDLYLDDRLVLSDTLDASGSYSGGFVFPIDLSNTEMHFLTAQDSTGEFAYSITCPEVTGVPAITPPGFLLLVLSLLGLAAIEMRKMYNR